MKTLMTFGCSWTYGVGAGYEEGMSDNEFKKIAWSSKSTNLAWRTIISNKLNLVNINLSEGGSSNSKQFRKATEALILKQDLDWIRSYNDIKDPSWPNVNSYDDYISLSSVIKEECKKIIQRDYINISEPDIVVWAITSIYRNEVWSNTHNEYFNFKYDVHKHNSLAKFYFKNFFNEEDELKKLTANLMLWNSFFKQNGIKIIWVDTFNTHKYLIDIPNLIRPHDLLTILADSDSVNDQYHKSSWINDCDRISIAKEKGFIEPISLHPSKEGHQKMADFLLPYIEDLLNE